MELYAKDMFYMGDTEAQRAYDRCIHGKVIFHINGKTISDESNDWCVSASAYRFLHTLFEDHISNETIDQMIPCCGHMLIPSDDLRRVSICGCPNGIDFDVRHEDDFVLIETVDGERFKVPYAVYKKAVIAFAMQVDDFYRQGPIRKFESDEDKDGFVAFANELHSLLCRARNSRDEKIEPLPCSYFGDYDMYWEHQLQSVSKEGILLKDGRLISFSECIQNFDREYGKTDSKCVGERDITQSTFTFYTSPKPVVLMFQKKGWLIERLKKNNTRQRFHNLQKQLLAYGYKTYDMS